MNPTRQLVSVILGLAVVSTASANLILLSDLRTVTAWSKNSVGENIYHTATAPPGGDFSGGVGATGVYVGMNSILGDGDWTFHTNGSYGLSAANLPAGADGTSPWAQNYGEVFFQITFKTDAPTAISLGGWRDNETLGGIMLASLSCSSGNIPLTWGGVFPYNNSLNQSLLLAPDTYTLTGRIQMSYFVAGSSYDGGTQRLDINVAAVPDSASSGSMIAVGLGALLLMRKRTHRVRASVDHAIEGAAEASG